jgi:hypothetical protein
MQPRVLSTSASSESARGSTMKKEQVLHTRSACSKDSKHRSTKRNHSKDQRSCYPANELEQEEKPKHGKPPTSQSGRFTAGATMR